MINVSVENVNDTKQIKVYDKSIQEGALVTETVSLIDVLTDKEDIDYEEDNELETDHMYIYSPDMISVSHIWKGVNDIAKLIYPNLTILKYPIISFGDTHEFCALASVTFRKYDNIQWDLKPLAEQYLNEIGIPYTQYYGDKSSDYESSSTITKDQDPDYISRPGYTGSYTAILKSGRVFPDFTTSKTYSYTTTKATNPIWPIHFRSDLSYSEFPDNVCDVTVNNLTNLGDRAVYNDIYHTLELYGIKSISHAYAFDFSYIRVTFNCKYDGSYGNYIYGLGLFGTKFGMRYDLILPYLTITSDDPSVVQFSIDASNKYIYMDIYDNGETYIHLSMADNTYCYAGEKDLYVQVRLPFSQDVSWYTDLDYGSEEYGVRTTGANVHDVAVLKTYRHNIVSFDSNLTKRTGTSTYPSNELTTNNRDYVLFANGSNATIEAFNSSLVKNTSITLSSKGSYTKGSTGNNAVYVYNSSIEAFNNSLVKSYGTAPSSISYFSSGVTFDNKMFIGKSESVAETVVIDEVSYTFYKSGIISLYYWDESLTMHSLSFEVEGDYFSSIHGNGSLEDVGLTANNNYLFISTFGNTYYLDKSLTIHKLNNSEHVYNFRYVGMMHKNKAYFMLHYLIFYYDDNLTIHLVKNTTATYDFMVGVGDYVLTTYERVIQGSGTVYKYRVLKDIS